MILETLNLGPMQTNCYILASAAQAEAIIIDPGDEEGKIKKVLNKHKLKPAFIINTHGHIDHIGCDDKFGVPVYVHQNDAALLKSAEMNLSSFLANPYCVESQIKILEEAQEISLGQITLEVIHLPGHTPGGIALLLRKPQNKILFTGDSLFYHGIGRTDFPGSDEKLLLRSIKEKLFKLSDDIIIYPGHGPASTLGEEKKNNPFCGRAVF